jgi:hypothetical protein
MSTALVVYRPRFVYRERSIEEWDARANQPDDDDDGESFRPPKDSSPYRSPEIIATEINACYRPYKRNRRENAEDVVAMGRLLLEARHHPEIGHGRWMSWVDANCAFCHETGRLYMRLAQAVDDNLITIQTICNSGIRPALEIAYPPEPEPEPLPPGERARRMRERFTQRLMPPRPPRRPDPDRQWPQPLEQQQALFVEWHPKKFAYIWLPRDDSQEKRRPLLYDYIFVHRGGDPSHITTAPYQRNWLDVIVRLNWWSENTSDDNGGILLDADRTRTEILEHWQYDVFYPVYVP